MHPAPASYGANAKCSAPRCFRAQTESGPNLFVIQALRLLERKGVKRLPESGRHSHPVKKTMRHTKLGGILFANSASLHQYIAASCGRNSCSVLAKDSVENLQIMAAISQPCTMSSQQQLHIEYVVYEETQLCDKRTCVKTCNR